MTAKERQNEIIESVNSKGYLTITEVVEKYDVSYETARRDFAFLQNSGYLRRVFGGAVPVVEVADDAKSFEDNYQSRDDALVQKMAEIANKEIKPGDTVFLGQGSTIRAIANKIKYRENIIVVTNSLYVAEELGDSNLTVFILGGLIEHDNLGIIGDITTETMSHFYCDKTFISCTGFDKDFGVMDFGGADPNVQKYALKRTKKKYLVAASKKFGVTGPLCICGVNDVDVIITDCNISEDYKSFIKEQGLKLLIAED